MYNYVFLATSITNFTSSSLTVFLWHKLIVIQYTYLIPVYITNYIFMYICVHLCCIIACLMQIVYLCISQKSSVKWNIQFLDLVDKLFTPMSTANVVYLANKCCALTSDDHRKITLFTPDFVNKLINCITPFVFKVYLLPYISWFNCAILRQLLIFSANEEAFKMVNDFTNSLDYS